MRAFVHVAAPFILSLKVEFEKVLSVLRTNADTVICHLDLYARLLSIIRDAELFNAHCNNMALRAKLDRVLNQVYYNLLASHFVDVNNHISITLRRVEFQSHIVCLGVVINHFDGRMNQLAQ
jgi:uncharacterized protein YqfB (UPF0267 family)